MYFIHSYWLPIMKTSKKMRRLFMKTSVIEFPRIGTLRELKFACEKY